MPCTNLLCTPSNPGAGRAESQGWAPALNQRIGCGYIRKLQVLGKDRVCPRADGCVPLSTGEPRALSCSGSRAEGCPLGSHPAGCRGSDAGAAPALLHLLLSRLCPTGAPCTAQGNTATIPHSVSTAFAQGAGVVSPQGFVGIFYPFCSPFNESVPGWK